MSIVDAVILNPRANGGAGAKRWRAVCADPVARKLGLESADAFDGPATDLRPELEEWLRGQLRAGHRRFAIAGGDGTVHVALNAYLELRRKDPEIPRDACFGAVGIGSSNDFHKPLGTPGRTRIAGYPARLDFTSAFPHDACRVEIGAPESSRYFFVNSSIGVTADANDCFNRGEGGLRALKRTWVDGAILWAALRTFAAYRNFPVSIRLDGGEAFERNLTNLGIVKNRHFSGSFHYDRGPAPDDGILGVNLCFDMGRGEMIRTLIALSRGNFSGRPKSECHWTRIVEVRSPAGAPFAIETDGEISHANACRYVIAPQELHLCP